MNDTAMTTLKSIAEIILGLGGLGGLAAVLTSIWTAKNERIKVTAQAAKEAAETERTKQQTEDQVPADAASTLAEASGKIATQYQDLLDAYQKNTDVRIGSMQREIEDLKKLYARRVIYLLNGIQMLIDQIVGLGATPCWSPNKSELDLPSDDGAKKGK